MKSKEQLALKACRNLGIERLNEMQNKTIEICNEAGDIVLLSPTGSGKTLAFLLPVLFHMQPPRQMVQALIIVPSRELALQIDRVLRTIAAGFKVCCCYGGHPVKEEIKSLSMAPDILVGTPGRILDHIERRNIFLENVHTVVLDEFDKCLELGFQEQMSSILKPLCKVKTRILTSATDSEDIPAFTGIKNPKKLNYLNIPVKEKRLSVFYVQSPEKDKLETLLSLLQNIDPGLTLIFCNQRESVERINGFLTSKRIINEAFHGGMEQPDRERALCKFRNQSSFILVSTDLAARGLDIPEVKHIIHYHLPLDEETYIHRNGRTARMHADGNAYLILGSTEQMPEYVKKDARTITLSPTTMEPAVPPMTTLHFSAGKKEKLGKGDIVGFLIQKGGIGKEDIGSIDIKDHYSYVAINREKAHKTLKQISQEKVKGKKIKIGFAL